MISRDHLRSLAIVGCILQTWLRKRYKILDFFFFFFAITSRASPCRSLVEIKYEEEKPMIFINIHNSWTRTNVPFNFYTQLVR